MSIFFCKYVSMRGQFLYLERGQKQTFLDPLSPSSSPRSYWMPPKATLKEEKNSFPFWSSGGPKINECEDGKREVSNPWFCMVDNRKKEKKCWICVTEKWSWFKSASMPKIYLFWETKLKQNYFAQLQNGVHIYQKLMCNMGQPFS